MALSILAITMGVGLLAFAADQFVLGAARVALLARMPALVVGVVIVGFGTSAPEMLVSASAALRGEPEVAIGNVVGSNVANLSLVLGIGALLLPLTVSSRTIKREAPLVVVAVILFGLAVQGGGISRLEGLGLLLAMALVLVIVTRTSPNDPVADDTEELIDADSHRLGPEIARTVAGIAGTIGGAQLLLWGALDIATRAQLSEGFVGATLVALGTSLPELVTVVQSARRKQTDLIIGNLLGSNLFNALGVGGLIGLVNAPPVDARNLTTVAVLASIAIAAGALWAMMTKHVVSRVEGAVLVAFYLCLLPFLT